MVVDPELAAGRDYWAMVASKYRIDSRAAPCYLPTFKIITLGVHCDAIPG
jgi:hypothetical protein